MDNVISIAFDMFDVIALMGKCTWYIYTCTFTILPYNESHYTIVALSVFARGNSKINWTKVDGMTVRE